MSATVCCLLGLVGWSIVLTLMLLGVRSAAIMKDGHALNIFNQQGEDLSDFGRRVTRAHANSLEWLAIPVALLLFGIATEQTAITDGLACYVIGTRVAQSIAHMISGATPVVLVRATFFTVQLVIWSIWVLKFAGIT